MGRWGGLKRRPPRTEERRVVVGNVENGDKVLEVVGPVTPPGPT